MARSMKSLALVPAVVLALGASAHAADVYSGCFKITNNKLRAASVLVNSTPICKATETLRTWNEQGPQGDQGPQGIPGVTNCAPQEVTGTCNANTFAVLNL